MRNIDLALIQKPPSNSDLDMPEYEMTFGERVARLLSIPKENAEYELELIKDIACQARKNQSTK